MKDSKKDLEEVIKKYKLYKRQIIAYEHKETDPFEGVYFKDMYEEYKASYTEIEFANLIHISKNTYKTALIVSNRGIILKNQKLGDKEKEVKKYLKKKYQLEGSIAYSTFLEIYEELKAYLTQPELAQFMKIGTDSYTDLRTGTIKRSGICLEEEEEDLEMIEKLGKKYDLAKEQLILYEYRGEGEYKGPYFKDLYEEYKEQYTEIEFAKKLGISENNFKSGMKYGGKARKILKNIVLSKEEKEEILEEIIQRFDLIKGQPINLEQFEQIHKPYKLKITKSELAEMLEITEIQRMNLKTRRAKILKNRELSKEEKEKILEDIIKKYDLKKKQLVKYEQEEGEEYKGPYFKEMHQEYKDYFTEIEFANLLQMYTTKDSLPIKHNKGRSEILVNRELSESDKKQIQEDIIGKYEGVLIKYKEVNNQGISFKTLYEAYQSKATEVEFAQYIGVGKKSLQNTRYFGKSTIIKDYIARRKSLSLIPKMEKRFYSKEEIENILSEYELTLKQLIEYVINKGRAYISKTKFEKYNQALEINKGLYLGRMKMSTQNIEENCEGLQRIARIISIKISKRFEIHKDKYKDLEGDILSFIIENYGDVINNFQYDNNLALGLVYRLCQ